MTTNYTPQIDGRYEGPDSKTNLSIALARYKSQMKSYRK